jgi:FkbM family methyltransferase
MRSRVRGHFNDWLYSHEHAKFCARFNAMSKIYWKSSVILNWDEQRGKIVVDEGAERLFIARPTRARRYRYGLSAKIEKLAHIYMLDKIEFLDGDCVIDCGANVGEIGFWLKAQGKNIDIISIEPEPEEADCCDLNLYSGEPKTVRKALWRNEGTMTLYSKNASADSSLFEIARYESTRMVEVTTISSLLNERKIAAVKLLKLEAEGAEPEILAGAEDCLERVEYISADLGPERGLALESTAAAVTNFLISRGFMLIDVVPGRWTFLFKNDRCVADRGPRS